MNSDTNINDLSVISEIYHLKFKKSRASLQRGDNKAGTDHLVFNIWHFYIQDLHYVYIRKNGECARSNSIIVDNTAVFYKNLHLTSATTRFIEEESLAPDAQVVDKTWRYVSESGGPDRRFNSNRQSPVCAYSEYMLKSDTGIYTTSKPAAMAFADFLTAIGSLQTKLGVKV